MYQLGQAPPNNVPFQIGTHDQPVKGVGYIRSSNLVVSGGWDSKLKFWDQRQQQPVGVFDLPERVYDLDVHENLLVVATAGRHIIEYDCSGQPREHSRVTALHKYQSRCISCFPDSKGFAVGSIEGRVAVHYLENGAGKQSFTFKCHRQESSVYAVNGIAFHPVHGTFATVGSDGAVNFWDKDIKSRIYSFTETKRPISCAAFNNQGNLFAYASSYDWSKGSSNVPQGNEIFIHKVKDDEILSKNRNVSGHNR
jgi:mRNA export factor